MKMTRLIPKSIITLTAAGMLFGSTGCAEIAKLTGATWHEKCGWKAEDYFDDPGVIELCHAIEKNDLTAMQRLIDDGVNVNTKGKGNMTPLLWAYPDNKLERFELLLKHGADPNVVVESEFNTHSAIMPGVSVTHMASESKFPGYFEAVFNNGGDPNLQKETLARGKGETPLFCLIKGSAIDKKAKIEQLIGKGTKLDHRDFSGMTPTMTAVGWGGQFDLALLLLKAGADYRIYQANDIQRLIHIVARQERRIESSTPKQKLDYEKLIEWLESRGESIEQARNDIRRWDSWSRTSGEYRRMMDAEIAERKAREARERAAAGEASDEKR